MTKKCIICSEVALYSIKASSDYYCQECTDDNFDDVSYLEKIEDLERKPIVEEKISEVLEDNQPEE